MTNIPCNYCLIESNCSNKMKTQCSQLALFESENDDLQTIEIIDKINNGVYYTETIKSAL